MGGEFRPHPVGQPRAAVFASRQSVRSGGIRASFAKDPSEKGVQGLAAPCAATPEVKKFSHAAHFFFRAGKENIVTRRGGSRAAPLQIGQDDRFTTTNCG